MLVVDFWQAQCLPYEESLFLVPMLCVGTNISISGYEARFPRWSMGTRDCK